MARKPKAAAKKSDSRWITVTAPFNYAWPGRSAVTHFHTPGEYRVKNEVADFATTNGYANGGKAEDQGTGTTADSGTVAPMGDEDAADADRPVDRPAVDPDAQ